MLMSCTKAMGVFRELICICCLFLVTGCQSSGAPENFESGGNSRPTAVPDKKARNRSGFKTSAISLFDRADAELKSGDLDAAKVTLLRLTEEQPELVSPWINLGIVSRNLGDSDTATEAFGRVLVIQPGSCDALNQLGIMAREAGDFVQAEAHYLACLEAMPEFSEVHLNLGILYELYMGKYASALSAYHSYLAGLNEPDQKVGNWIRDLERRQSSMLATDNF